jgi:CRP-like cAMP-binding protein
MRTAARDSRSGGKQHSRQRRTAVSSSLPEELPGSRPQLSDKQLAVVKRYGSEHATAAGDVLFADGDETYDLIVLVQGTAEIVEGHGRPASTLINSYGPGEFLGEVGLLTGQRAFLTAVVREPGSVIRVPAVQVQVIMAQETDLSELILRAFLARHARRQDRDLRLLARALIQAPKGSSAPSPVTGSPHGGSSSRAPAKPRPSYRISTSR